MRRGRGDTGRGPEPPKSQGRGGRLSWRLQKREPRTAAASERGVKHRQSCVKPSRFINKYLAAPGFSTGPEPGPPEWFKGRSLPPPHAARKCHLR